MVQSYGSFFVSTEKNGRFDLIQTIFLCAANEIKRLFEVNSPVSTI